MYLFELHSCRTTVCKAAVTGCPFRFGRHGYPDKKRVFIFNGDYVDRGSWGVELLTLLTCLKLACPTRWGPGYGGKGRSCWSTCNSRAWCPSAIDIRPSLSALSTALVWAFQCIRTCIPSIAALLLTKEGVAALGPLSTTVTLSCATPITHRSMFMLRGNHESSTCTKYYGYQAEVKAKYEKAAKVG